MPHVPGSSGRRPDRSASSCPSHLRDDVGGARSEHAQARPGSGGERRHPQVAVGAGAVSQRQERVVVAGRRRGGCRSRRRRGSPARTAAAPDRRGDSRGRAGRRRPSPARRFRATHPPSGPGASARSATRTAGRPPARPLPAACAACGGRSPSAGSETPSAAFRSRARARRAPPPAAALGASGLSTTTASPASRARSASGTWASFRCRDHHEIVLVRESPELLRRRHHAGSRVIAKRLLTALRVAR